MEPSINFTQGDQELEVMKLKAPEVVKEMESIPIPSFE
jgi:hypothetical protein